MINRFLEARRKANRETGVWHRQEFCYTCACLELDMFKAGTVTKVCASKLGEHAEPATSSAKETVGSEKNIRASWQNVLVLSALVYQDKGILVRLNIFVAASEPLDLWHHDQSVACRSVMGTRQFLVSQLANGNVLGTMYDVFGKLASHADLAYVASRYQRRFLFLFPCTYAQM